MSARAKTKTIRFNASPTRVGDRTILRLPKGASEKLPSRGQVAVEGTIDGHAFETVLEPDGTFGHWISVDSKLQRAARLTLGTVIPITVSPREEWPEPDVPDDLAAALAAAPREIRYLWQEITPMARWEWVRWINATRNPETRSRRVEVSISKLSKGSRRPCCFNLASCTDPELSRSGRLIE